MPFKHILFNIFTSGKFSKHRNTADIEYIIRCVVLNVAFIMGGGVLCVYGISLLGQDRVRGLLDLTFTALCIITFFLLRTSLPLFVSGIIPLAPFAGYLFYLVLGGGLQGYTGLWIYTYPLMSIFILGIEAGAALTALLFIGIGIAVFTPGLAGYAYSREIAVRICTIYFMITMFTVAYELVRRFKERQTALLTQALQTERDEIAAMKDNLKAGIFLMNRDNIIQGAYSKALEKVLSVVNIQGRNFLDLLSASVKTKEAETIKDYFDMVINRSFDDAMLEDINPLRELVYKSVETGEERILRCAFAPVNRTAAEVFILGTIEDITAGQELQRRLEEEEGKRQEEMRSLFEIVHVEPKIFNEFIEDSEYEFDRINMLLKDSGRSSNEVMKGIFQSVHAVKSNAIILGLTSYSKKLHALEDQINVLRDLEEISFEEWLHITVELERIMHEKDKYRETIDRILASRSPDEGKRRVQILTETLAKICDRAARDLNKSARFVTGNVDEAVIETGYRRIIKEILTQLVRNAVVHGIEPPEERIAAGKNAQGIIQFSADIDNGAVHIYLKDDGRGLDFEKIRELALERNLLKKEQAEDKKQLLRALFAPGFSTAGEVDMHGGRGVGLSLVRDRLKEVKGGVKVNTEQGRGTTFNISIPLEADTATTKVS